MKTPSPKPATTDALGRLRSVLSPSSLGAALVALLYASTLSPSDIPPDLSAFAVPSMLWMALGCAAAGWLVLRGERFDVVDYLAGAFLAVTLLSTINVWNQGDLRSAINAFFQTAALVPVVVMGRRLFRSAAQRREAFTLLLMLVVALSLFGIVQYLWLYPARNASLLEHKEEILAAQGITDADSPEAHRLLDRALSPEPLATFTLTNSLAAVLAPGVLLVGAAAISLWQQGRSRVAAALLTGAALCVLLCLMLTKSRASVLALGLGLVLFGAAQFRFVRTISRTWWPAAAGIAVVIGGLIWWGVGSDRAILSEAPTSVAYRLQYWTSTWDMIGDYPLLGCGPGNFKSVYPHYKLPEASEEIGDPHNFLLEIAANVGLPALALFLSLLLAIFLADRMPSQHEPDDGPREQPRWLWLGAIVGLLLAGPLSLFVGGPLNLPMLGIGLGVIAAGYLLIRSAMGDDVLAGPAVGIAAIMMLVNLLAAGGIGFPNVSLPLALLLALLAPAKQYNGDAVSSRAANRSSYATLAVTVGLALGCFFTCYLPVVLSQQNRERALALRTVGESQSEVCQVLVAAMHNDPFNALPALDVATCEVDRYALTGNPLALDEADAALQEAVRRNPRSYAVWQFAAETYLEAHTSSGDDQWRRKAIHAYESATARYPNYAVLHARLAWVLHLDGRSEAARKTAAEAMRLDALCPHRDKKLASHRLDAAGRTARERETPLDELMRQIAAPRK